MVDEIVNLNWFGTKQEGAFKIAVFIVLFDGQIVQDPLEIAGVSSFSKGVHDDICPVGRRKNEADWSFGLHDLGEFVLDLIQGIVCINQNGLTDADFSILRNLQKFFKAIGTVSIIGKNGNKMVPLKGSKKSQQILSKKKKREKYLK